MATIVDDYIILGASGDNFDCDSTGGWTEGGNASAATTQSSPKVEGTNSLGLQTSGTGDCYWYHDISLGYRFKITEKDLGLWFFYLKGKGNNYLVQNSTAVVVRLYFGGTSKYADYRVTEAGDLSLEFGWQMLMCSGTELNGGSTGGGHNGTTDWDLDIYRFEFHLNVANKVDHNLGLDAIFVGTELEVQSGTSTTPVTIADLYDYTFSSRSGFPIGTVNLIDKLADIKSGLKITNGGYVAAEELYLLFNQGSSQVKHNLTITNGTFRIGRIENGNPIRGCQIVKPSGKSASILVDTSGNFEVYNSKFYRWTNIQVDGYCNFIQDDFDSNEVFICNSSSVNVSDCSIHNATTNSNDESVKILVNPNKFNNTLIYRNNDGLKGEANSTVSEITFLDNTGSDLVVKDSTTMTVLDSTYSTIERSL